MVMVGVVSFLLLLGTETTLGSAIFDPPRPTLPLRSDSKADCDQPKAVGHCRASISRWYFNTSTRECEGFIFGGCGGNGNNFASKALCQSHCAPRTEEERGSKARSEAGPCVEKSADPNAPDGFVGTFTAICTSNGYFRVEQCDGGECWCVEAGTGAEIPSTRVPAATQLSCHECLKQRASELESNGDATTLCDEQGRYRSMQCNVRECWCVGRESGEEVEGTRGASSGSFLDCDAGRGFSLPPAIAREAVSPTFQRQGACALAAGDEDAEKAACTPRGDYVVEQCRSSTGFCWCVDPETGIEAPASRRRGTPKCASCFRRKALVLAGKARGSPSPRCDALGHFHAIQCDAESGHCWCAQPQSGGEIAGTRSPPGVVPDCASLGEAALKESVEGVEEAGSSLLGRGPCSDLIATGPLDPTFMPQCSPSGLPHWGRRH